MAENILVVDDDDAIRNMLDAFLKVCGYEVDTAEGVDAALKLMESNDYDIMLIDINMPGIDGGSEGGIDLLRHVWSKSLSSGVLMMTGNPTVESTAEALKLGAFDYIHKPFSLGYLRLKINILLQDRNL
jgi:DNA-binding response OmpR family regulator